jgi:hypothetical protein
MFIPMVPRFVFGSRTDVVACASDTHCNVLGNLEREISIRVFRLGLPSVQLFKSVDKSVKSF